MTASNPQTSKAASLRNSTTVFLVGNIEEVMRWYETNLGFSAEYYPPGFCILSRDAVSIFLQQQPGYVRPDDPGARAREAWSVYIENRRCRFAVRRVLTVLGGKDRAAADASGIRTNRI